MPIGIGAALLGGAAIQGLGSIFGASAASKAAQKSADQQLAFQREMLGLSAPYRELSERRLGDLEGLRSQEGRAAYMQSLSQDPSFMMDLADAEQSALRTASATGGLRTGQTIEDVSRIPSQLKRQYLMDEENRMLQDIQLGAGFVGQAPGFAGMGTQTLSNLGGIQTQAAQAPWQALGNFASDAAGLYSAQQLGYLNPAGGTV